MRVSIAFIISMFWVSIIGAQNINISAEVTSPSCAGFSNGIIELFVSGGEAPYQFQWNTGATTINLMGVGAGTYEVTVTDANGDSNTKSFPVAEPMPVEAAIQANTDICSPGTQEYEAIVTGGTPPYSYEWNNGQTTATLQTETAGDYFLKVTDVNGCGTNVFVKVPEPFSVEVVTTPTNCADFCDASARAAVTGGTAPYTFLWNTGQTDQVIESLPIGIYDVTVTDANGCTFEASGEATAPPIINIDIEVEGTCELGDISATAILSGGVPPLRARWSTGATDLTITELVPGQTYSIRVTDANGCEKEEEFTVPQEPSLVLNASKTDISCGSESGGAASVEVLSGTAPYTYAWSNGATTAAISDLEAGEYTVTVTDAEGCVGEETVKINFLDGLILDLSAVDVICVDDENGMANVVPSGGTEPYVYLWSDGQTVGTAQNLTPGDYSVTVTDILGCQATGTVTVEAAIEVELTVQLDEANNAATIIATGGDEPYTYSWSHDNTITTPTATNLVPGEEYTVTVTDRNGCPATITFRVPNNSPLDIDVETQGTCTDEATGSATLTVTGGVEPYTIEWNTGSTGETIESLAPGDYSVTVTDAQGNTQTISFTIEGIELALDFDTTPQGCTAEDGTATVNVEGGTAPYTFEWSNDQTTQTIEELAFGTYQVTVEDENGCSAEDEITIDRKQIALETTAINAGCNDENSGSAIVVATGGTAPYTYEWSNGASVDTLTNIAAGFYEVVVSDATGCEEAAFVTIEQDENITVEASATPTGCTNPDGTVVVTPQTGDAPFTYIWSTGDNTATIEGLEEGTYSVTVVDANGCSGEAEATVESTNVNLELDVTNAGCEGEATGAATVTPVGGNEPYTYAWSNGASTPTIENVQPGFYEVTVTDATGCEKIEEINIEKESINLTTTSQNISCTGGTLGAATVVSVDGGTAPFNYEWSNDIVADSAAVDLEAGEYLVTVTDANGCTSEATFNIVQDENIAITSTTSNATCELENGTATAIPSTGIAPFTFEWSNGSDQSVITGVAAGTYSVTVTDDTGCQGETTVDISTENPLMVTPTVVNASCDGVENGSATLEVEGATGALTFQWSIGVSTSTVNNLAQGEFGWTVTDENGCEQTGMVNVGQDEAIDVNISASDACVGEPVDISVENNIETDTLSYEWLPVDLFETGTANTATPIFIGTDDAEVSVVITNQLGCSEERSLPISFNPNTTPNVDNISFEESCLGLIVNFNGTDEIEGYTWDFGNPNDGTDTSDELNPTYTYTEIGTYTVSLTPSDDLVCANPVSFDIEVTGPEALTFAIDGSPTICGDSTSTLSINDPSLTEFQWFRGEEEVSNASSYTAEAGEYRVVARNEEGCEGENTIVVEDRSINVFLEERYAACIDEATELILENLNSGDLLLFDWQTENPDATIDDPTAENPTVTISETTVFNTTITNQFGCSITEEITVEAGEVPTVDSVVSSRDTINLGESVDLEVIGADGDYIYEWIEGGNALDDITQPNPEATPIVEGENEYIVSITSLDGCEIEDRVSVVVLDLPCEEPYIFVPNAFTPNNDGINDILYVRGFNIDEMHFVIYNRWGELVFETRDQDEGWDGRHNGDIAEGRVFGYILEVRCTGGQTREFKGNVTLLR